MSKLFAELTALKKAYDEKLEKQGEDAVKEVFKEFFDKHPSAESITWRQYTPYFNDGDPCYFSVHEFNLTLNDSEEELAEEEEPEEEEELVEDEEPEEEFDEYDEGEYDSYTLSESSDPKLQKMGEDMQKLEEIPEDVLEKVFGDHVIITATRDGFDVNEYNHD